MVTVKRLREMLASLPDDAKCNAYEGEDVGLSITAAVGEQAWWIRAHSSDDEDDQADFGRAVAELQPFWLSKPGADDIRQARDALRSVVAGSGVDEKCIDRAVEMFDRVLANAQEPTAEAADVASQESGEVPNTEHGECPTCRSGTVADGKRVHRADCPGAESVRS